MAKRIPVVWLLIGVAISAGAQTAPAVFEVVSVKRSAAGADAPTLVGRLTPNGNWTVRNATLTMILGATSNLLPDQIEGGPAWLRRERFDIEARAPGGVAESELPAMVRALLADRFSLRLHTEQKSMEMWALVRAREDGALGRGLRPNDECTARAAAQARGLPVPAQAVGAAPFCGRASMRVVDGVRQLRLTGQPIGNLLPLSGARAAFGTPVVDRTGLTGTFDIALDFVPPAAMLAAPAGAAPAGPALTTAVEEQLNLRFERRAETMDVLVIDHVEMPTEN